MNALDLSLAPPIVRALAERLKSGRTGLRLLVLFGSRARNDAHQMSDWDFGFIGDATFDMAALMAELIEALEPALTIRDNIDLVDLTRANAQLRYRAASDARVIYEAEPGAFFEFWFEAVSFWCDMGPVLRSGYEDVLARLPR